MQILRRELDDVLIITRDISDNFRDFSSLFSAQEMVDLGINDHFVQDNHSVSKQGVLRGLHYQIDNPQGKLIYVLHGVIFDVVVDLRKGSPNFGKHATFELSESNGLIAWIPKGYAHGFMATSPQATVIYKVTDYRYPEHERTMLWNDPHLAINWPLNNVVPIISEKDKNGTCFVHSEYYS